jgi:hypothetical protein
MVVIKSAVFPRTAEGTKYNNIPLIDKKCYSTLYSIYIKQIKFLEISRQRSNYCQKLQIQDHKNKTENNGTVQQLFTDSRTLCFSYDRNTVQHSHRTSYVN